MRPGGEPGQAELRASDSGRSFFLAFLADKATEAAIRSGLGAEFDGIEIRRGNVRTAVKALAGETTPHILLVDISGIEDPFEALDELAGVCTPDVRVFAVGEQSDVQFYRRMTRELGVIEYLYKPLNRHAVSMFIAPLLAGHAPAPPSPRGGQVIAVCGACGGVGTTTVAVNLALELAAMKGHVALLDLHLRGGGTGLMLGQRPGAGLRVALEDPDRLDTLFLDRVAIPIDERLRLLAAEEPFDSFPRPTAQGVSRLLEVMRSRFTHIVVDLPNPPSEAERALLAAARHVAIVLGPDVAGIRDADATRSLVKSVAPAALVSLVLNRSGTPGALKPALVADGLGTPMDVVIPDLSRHLPRAANLGQPGRARQSGLSRALAPLLHEIVGGINPAMSKKSLFDRWRGR